MAVDEVSEEVAGDGAARSVQGAQGGLCETAVTTTVVVFDLAKWKGRYVKVTPKGDGIYYVFSDQAAGGAGTLNPATEALDSAAPSLIIPDFTDNKVPVHEIVPKKRPYLHVRSDTGTAEVRVRRA